MSRADKAAAAEVKKLRGRETKLQKKKSRAARSAEQKVEDDEESVDSEEEKRTKSDAGIKTQVPLTAGGIVGATEGMDAAAPPKKKRAKKNRSAADKPQAPPQAEQPEPIAPPIPIRQVISAKSATPPLWKKAAITPYGVIDITSNRKSRTVNKVGHSCFYKAVAMLYGGPVPPIDARPSFQAVPEQSPPPTNEPQAPPPPDPTATPVPLPTPAPLPPAAVNVDAPSATMSVLPPTAVVLPADVPPAQLGVRRLSETKNVTLARSQDGPYNGTDEKTKLLVLVPGDCVSMFETGDEPLLVCAIRARGKATGEPTGEVLLDVACHPQRERAKILMPIQIRHMFPPSIEIGPKGASLLASNVTGVFIGVPIPPRIPLGRDYVEIAYDSEIQKRKQRATPVAAQKAATAAHSSVAPPVLQEELIAAVVKQVIKETTTGTAPVQPSPSAPPRPPPPGYGWVPALPPSYWALTPLQ